jgi:hypothetical protein
MKRGKSAEDTAGPKITPSNAKRAIAVGKIVAPVLMPVAIRAAGVARGAWDEYRARRLGVPPGELARYSGRGGALNARISRIAQAMIELRATSELAQSHAGDRKAAASRRTAEVAEFIADAEPRLIDLSSAVHAAEFMPTERRRSAYRAVSVELDRIEPRLLDLLGVDSSR